MGFQSVVSGYITLKGSNIEKDIHFLREYKDDGEFPWILRDMFSIPDFTHPYHYNNPIVAFAATYKQIAVFWTEWMIKFEQILRNLNFEAANITLETGECGNYFFYWESKDTSSDLYAFQKTYKQSEKLFESDSWFYGYGFRDSNGFLISGEEIDDVDMTYLTNFRHPSECHKIDHDETYNRNSRKE